MLQQIKELLTNTQLQQQIKEAATLAEAVQLIMAAGAEKGYNFAKESVSQFLAGQMLTTELTEQDLLAVAGGRECEESARTQYITKFYNYGCPLGPDSYFPY
jgi:DNA-binding transcriptional regulator LsrR (DeoR family)